RLPYVLSSYSLPQMSRTSAPSPHSASILALIATDPTTTRASAQNGGQSQSHDRARCRLITIIPHLSTRCPAGSGTRRSRTDPGLAAVLPERASRRRQSLKGLRQFEAVTGSTSWSRG